MYITNVHNYIGNILIQLHKLINGSGKLIKRLKDEKIKTSKNQNIKKSKHQKIKTSKNQKKVKSKEGTYIHLKRYLSTYSPDRRTRARWSTGSTGSRPPIARYGSAHHLTISYIAAIISATGYKTPTNYVTN